MEDYAPSTFLGSWALVAPYLCFRPVLEEYVEGGLHLLWSCLHVARDGFPPIVREMHLYFECLIVIDALGLQASSMDIHHNTSFRSILEDDFISLTSRIRIHFYSGKGARLWLITKPFICSFYIAHFFFTLALRFRFDLIQPSASNLLTCECGHELDTSSTHLTRCPFGGQWIATDDVI
jgi:hypothetical protein